MEQGLEKIILEILTGTSSSHGYNFDKYDIGRRMVEDMETWAAGRNNKT
jgi:hypothetical protein